MDGDSKSKNPHSNCEFLYDVNDNDDLSYNFFLFQYDISKYSSNIYITSKTNDKYTVILYLEPSLENFILLVLENKIKEDPEKIKYKAKSVIKLPREKIEKLEEDESLNKDIKNIVDKYQIFIVSENCVLMQCLKKKILLIDFDKKKYSTLFVNTEIKRSLRVVSTYDELIMIKNPKQTKLEIRTYVFCISNRQLFFFILNYKAIWSNQFIAYFFPFEDYFDSIEEFFIQRIENTSQNYSSVSEKKWYYIFILLLDGKFVRYVSNYVDFSVKEILLNFRNLLKNGTIRKCVNTFEKTNECHTKFVHSNKGISFILLQFGWNDALGFKYYSTDTPDEIKKRFCIGEDDTADGLNDGSSISGVSVNDSVRRSSKVSFNFNLSGNAKSPERTTNTIITTSDSAPSAPNGFISKEKDVIHYSFILSNNHVINNFNEGDIINGDGNNVINMEECPIDFGGIKTAKQQNGSRHKLKYTYNSYHLIKITPFNTLSIFSFPTMKDIDILKSKLFYEYHFNQKDILIYDLLHYPKLSSAYVLTNKYILRVRYNSKIHSLYVRTQHVDRSPSTFNDDFYTKMRIINKYEKSSYAKSKCKVCHNKKIKVKCDECKKAFYCCYDHYKYDMRNYHFIECEINKMLVSYDKEKVSDSFYNLNQSCKMIMRSMSKMFYYIKKETDYREYLIFVKIFLNILRVAKLENYLSKNFYDYQKAFNYTIVDIDNVVYKIFNMELFFFYLNLDLMYLRFAEKGKFNLLSTSKLLSTKLIDLYMKRIDNRNITTFSYFGFGHDNEYYYTKAQLEQMNPLINSLFFDFYSIYADFDSPAVAGLETNVELVIYRVFISYHLQTVSSLVKAGVNIFQKTKNFKIQNYIVNNVLSLLPIIFEERYTPDNNIETFPLITISLTYFLMSFILVRLNRISTSIKILNYVLSFVQQINYDFVYKKFYSFEATVLYNTGVLAMYIGDNEMAIHKLEECYRICFFEGLSTSLLLKSMHSLILSYINTERADTAYIMIWKMMKYGTQNTKMKSKLEIYLLFLIAYLSYKYNKKNKDVDITKKIAMKSQEKESTVLDYVKGIEIPSSISSKNVYIGKDTYNEVIDAVEFLYDLNDEFYNILNTDNSAIKIENVVKDEVHDKSMSVSRDISMNTSFTTVMFSKENHVYKEEENNFFDEIEIKASLYDKFSSRQKYQLRLLNNKIFLRSLTLRDPKGRIDKFNLNYHPKFSYNFMKLISKCDENYFLKKISDENLLDPFDEKIFENESLLVSLKKFLRTDRIMNIIYIDKNIQLENENKKKGNPLSSSSTQKIHQMQIDISNDEKKKLIKKIKEELTDGQFDFIGYVDDALDQLFSTLTEEELVFILENPKCIFNYLYPDPESKIDFKSQDENSSSSDEKSKSESGISYNTNILGDRTPLNRNFLLNTPSNKKRNNSIAFTSRRSSRSLNKLDETVKKVRIGISEADIHKNKRMSISLFKPNTLNQVSQSSKVLPARTTVNKEKDFSHFKKKPNKVPLSNASLVQVDAQKPNEKGFTPFESSRSIKSFYEQGSVGSGLGSGIVQKESKSGSGSNSPGSKGGKQLPIGKTMTFGVNLNPVSGAKNTQVSKLGLNKINIPDVITIHERHSSKSKSRSASGSIDHFSSNASPKPSGKQSSNISSSNLSKEPSKSKGPSGAVSKGPSANISKDNIHKDKDNDDLKNCSIIDEEKSNSPFVTEGLDEMLSSTGRKVQSNIELIKLRKQSIQPSKIKTSPNLFKISEFRKVLKDSKSKQKSNLSSNKAPEVQKDLNVPAKKDNKIANKKEPPSPMQIINALIGKEDEVKKTENTEISSNRNTNSSNISVSVNINLPPESRQKPSYNTLRNMVFKRKVNSKK